MKKIKTIVTALLYFSAAVLVIVTTCLVTIKLVTPIEKETLARKTLLEDPAFTHQALVVAVDTFRKVAPAAEVEELNAWTHKLVTGEHISLEEKVDKLLELKEKIKVYE